MIGAGSVMATPLSLHLQVLSSLGENRSINQNIINDVLYVVVG